MARSNMTSQRTATKRNAQAEQVSHFILKYFAQNLLDSNLITEYSVSTQEQFNSEVSRDRWDHTLNIQLSEENSVEIWGQTTCYKGHIDGATESNKTYEVRETLTEALCLVAAKSPENDFRTIHITFGDPDYVYSWFRPMKENTFDFSLYLDDPSDIFNLIDESIGTYKTESQIYKKLESEIEKSSKLGRILTRNIAELKDWHSKANLKRSDLSMAQGALVKAGIPEEKTFKALMAHATGDNIKKKAVDTILSSSQHSDDALVQEVVTDLLDRKPFLKSANSQTIEWDSFVEVIRSLWKPQASEIENLVSLWNPSNQSVLESIRRILLRIHSEETTDYVQDLGIAGITEHNLYGGKHSPQQAEQIARIIIGNLVGNDNNPAEIVSLISKKGKAILRNQIYFEAKNGTSSTSSFDFIQKAVTNSGFKIVNSAQAGIELIGYHSEITGSNVRPYTNFKIVKDKTGKTLCILKGKFFSVKEFDRRCKEEGFVGLSLQYRWDGKNFVKRFPIPIVICIDMESDFTPPDFAVRKLVAMGWSVAFGPDHLIQILDEM